MKQEYKYPTYAWVIFWIVNVLLFLSNPLIILIQIALFFWLKTYFTRWAFEIKRNPVTPFMLMLFFGLLGYLGYYIYYRVKVKEKRK